MADATTVHVWLVAQAKPWHQPSRRNGRSVGESSRAVDHAEHLSRPFPWRTATVVVGAVAAVELVALIGIGATHVAASLRTHATAAPPAHAAKAAPQVHRHVLTVRALPPHP